MRLTDGPVVPRRTIAAAARMQARGALLGGLGLAAVPHPMGAAVGEYFPSGPMGVTTVPGALRRGQRHPSAGSGGRGGRGGGALAGAAIHGDLIQEDTAAAVARHRRSADSVPV